MGNPFESPYESLRQSIIDESKKKAAKRQKRWQDDDCDGKWYEKSDTDGKISKREKKAQAKHYKYEEIEVKEADSLSAQVARWEAGRQRRMKRSGSYERPNWIPRDQDHEDRYGSSKGEKKKPQKTHANLQNEEKEELEIQENRMAAYTAGAGEGSPASRPTVSKKTADRVSRSSDERAFGNRKKKEGIRLSPTKKYSGKDAGKTVKRANTTGRGTPTQYRKSHEDPDMGRYQQKVTQGTGSVKGLKKEHHQKDADGNTIPHEEINELKTSTLRSYVNRASIDAVGRGVDAGVKGMTGPKKEMEKNMTKAYKRQRGINTAANKLASRAEKNENFSPESTIVRDILVKKN